MTTSEAEARMTISIACGLVCTSLNTAQPVISLASTEAFYSLANMFRLAADEIEKQARVIDGSGIDEVIERSKA